MGLPCSWALGGCRARLGLSGLRSLKGRVEDTRARHLKREPTAQAAESVGETCFHLTDLWFGSVSSLGCLAVVGFRV